MKTATIQILSHDLSVSGLSITYSVNQKRLTLLASPVVTADLLMRCNYILNYKFKNDRLIILKEITEDAVTPKGIETRLVGKKSLDWNYFVRNFMIDEIIAEEICQLHESTEKETETEPATV